MKFTEFNLHPLVLEGIDALGYEEATPVQDLAIPAILQGRDLLASAQTGTGKTAAFLLPLIHKMITEQEHSTLKAMVIVPTRELAVQIDQQMEGLSYFANITSVAVYGGSDGAVFTREKQALMEGADLVVCTPGRMLSHLNMGYVKLQGLRYLILDEADRMLDMGFYDDIMKMVSFLPKTRQNLLFSATMPSKIREMADKLLNDPVRINIAVSKPAERVLQAAYVVYEKQKIPFITQLLERNKLRSILIFCSRKIKAKDLNRDLKRRGFLSEEIHSDLEQTEREDVLNKFRSRAISILVATDILSRGIDIEDIDLIINFDVPNDGEDYIHRIGRTARAQSDGVALTLIGEDEQRKFAAIEELLGAPVYKDRIPADLGPTPEYKPMARSKSTGFRRSSPRPKPNTGTRNPSQRPPKQ
jgi:superfamily II DNA/RNA helicase